MNALGATASALLLGAAMLLFGWLVHVLAIVAGEGMSIATGVARGIGVWGREVVGQPPDASAEAPESPTSAPPAEPDGRPDEALGLDVRRVVGSVRSGRAVGSGRPPA